MATDWALAVEALEDGLMVIGPDERVAACNPAAARLLGHDTEALVGVEASEIGIPEIGMVPGANGVGWLRVTSVDLADGARVVSLTDVTAERDRERDLRRLAELDELTGLPNRLHFLAVLQRHLDSQRAEDAGGALLLLRLDGIQALSDRVLVQIAEVLRERLRTDDALALIGAGEFAMLLRRTPPDDAAGLVRSLAGELVPGASVSVVGLDGAPDAEQALAEAVIGLSQSA